MRIKRLLAVLLAALLLPLGMFTVAQSADAEAENDIWAQITEYEDLRLSEQGIAAENAEARDFGAMADGVAAIITAWSGYVPGSLYRNGDFLIWDGTDGMGYGYSPRFRKILRSQSMAAGDPEDVRGTETETHAVRGGSPDSFNVTLFGPYYGLDSSFTNQYRTEAQSIAQATGGTYTCYQKYDVNIDVIADALESSGVVIFDSHGNTDYSSGYDYTSRANTSYLCINSGTGVTAEDTATVSGPYGSYKHALNAGGSSYFIDGTAIANHMEGTAPNSLLWMAICLGMATDGLEAPLRDRGVEVVYGYSQSVTFAGDYAWENHFWTKMKAGTNVAEAIAYMKQKGGVKDPYEYSYPAYPIVASSEDEYPGHGNVDATQDVHSLWTLFTQYEVTAVSSDTSLGTVSVSGNRITAMPNTGCAVTGYEVTEGIATVRQNGNGFSTTTFDVSPKSDCTVRIDFSRRAPASLSYVTPDGASCTPVSGYEGDTVTLPKPSGRPSADGHAYAFYGWVDARVDDSDTRPAFYRAGTSFTLAGDRTLYALYSYAVSNSGSVPEGGFLPMVSDPDDWSGSVVLTYDGETVLSANTTASKVGTASAAVSTEDAGITVKDDLFTGVAEAYQYEIEAVGSYYTMRMKGVETPTYLCYATVGDKLSATKKIIVASQKSSAYWALSWEDGNPVFVNSMDTAATLRFDADKGVFTCKKNNGGSPLTVFTATDSKLMYTTELKNASEIEPDPIAIETAVEWNADDVQYKGATPFVLANGAPQTPRFTVRNKADGSVVDPANYDFEYRENTNAGTGYVFVTLKGEYTGSCRGSFKIYLPATEATAVENVQDGIQITWAPVEGAAGYVIYRRAWSSTTNGWTAFARWDNTTETTYIDGCDASHKVYAGTRYQYGVKAYFARRVDPVTGAEIGGNVNADSGNFNLGEVGPLKTTVRITTRTLSSVTAKGTELTVKWTASSVFTGVEIQYATDEAFQNAAAVRIAGSAAQTTLTGLASGTTYYVRVRSYQEFEGMTYFGGWSNVLSQKTN